jgi:hypothetical protein
MDAQIIKGRSGPPFSFKFGIVRIVRIFTVNALSLLALGCLVFFLFMGSCSSFSRKPTCTYDNTDRRVCSL